MLLQWLDGDWSFTIRDYAKETSNNLNGQSQISCPQLSFHVKKLSVLYNVESKKSHCPIWEKGTEGVRWNAWVGVTKMWKTCSTALSPLNSFSHPGSLHSILKRKGAQRCWSLHSIAYSPRKDLLQIKGIIEVKVDKIFEAKLVPLGFTSAG